MLRHPARAALAGALAIAFSAIIYRTSDVSPETGAFFRCVYALPVLWLLVRLEERTPRTSTAKAPADGLGRRRVLRRRPAPLAPHDRGGRRGSLHRAGEHPGRSRRPDRLGALPRASGACGAGRDPDRDARHRAHLGCVRGRCLRRQPAARCASRRPHRVSPTRAFSSLCATVRATIGASPDLSSTRRSRRRR